MYIQLVGSVHKAWQITQINTSPLVAIVAFGSFSGRLLMGGTVDLMYVLGVTRVKSNCVLTHVYYRFQLEESAAGCRGDCASKCHVRVIHHFSFLQRLCAAVDLHDIYGNILRR